MALVIMAASQWEQLMTCSDQLFDRALQTMDNQALMAVILIFQEAMAVEQHTFNSLSQQLDKCVDLLSQQRLSAALCASQTRLAQLCSRSMKCFIQHSALESKQHTGQASLPKQRSQSVSSTSSSRSNASSSVTLVSLNGPQDEIQVEDQPTRLRKSTTLIIPIEPSSSPSPVPEKYESLVYISGNASDAILPAADDFRSLIGVNSSPPSVVQTKLRIQVGPPPTSTQDSVNYCWKSCTTITLPDQPQDTTATHEDMQTVRRLLYTEKQARELELGRPKRQQVEREPKAALPVLTHQANALSNATASTTFPAGSSSAASLPCTPDHQKIARTPGEETSLLLRLASESDTPVLPAKTSPTRPWTPSGSTVKFAAFRGEVFDNDDLSYFKERIGIVADEAAEEEPLPDTNTSPGLMHRARSYTSGLNLVPPPLKSYPLSRSTSVQSLEPTRKQQRVPSVEDILQSVKNLRQAMVRNQEESVKNWRTSNASHYNEPRRLKAAASLVVVATADEAIYENLHNAGEEHYENVRVYDTPKKANFAQGAFVSSHYQNMNFQQGVDEPDEAIYENHHPTYANVNAPHGVYDKPKARPFEREANEYDFPRPIAPVYATPQSLKAIVPPQDSQYDQPKSLIPQSASLLLLQQVVDHESDNKDCEADSLDGDADTRPDIPDPDYASDDDLAHRQDGDSIDEDDAVPRNGFDDTVLGIILEEPEEEDGEDRMSPSRPCSSQRENNGGKPRYRRATSSSSNSSHSAEDESSTSSGVHSEETLCVVEGTPEPDIPDLNGIDAVDQGISFYSADTLTNIPQADRCIEVYNETLRQRNCKSPKIIIQESPYGAETIRNRTKLLPSVKALRSQFETTRLEDSIRKPMATHANSNRSLKEQLSDAGSDSGASVSSRTSIEEDQFTSPTFVSETSNDASSKSRSVSHVGKLFQANQAVEPIHKQFGTIDPDLLRPRAITKKWDPTALLNDLYQVPTPVPFDASEEQYITIEGYLDKLPTGKRKNTFWNAWKRLYFKAQDGQLHCYQSNLADKPVFSMQLMGGHIDFMESNMIGIDDGKSHYMVVKCPTLQEAEQWRLALMTHTQEHYVATYVQPYPLPKNPKLFLDTVIIDLGSSSVRAGRLTSEPTLPEIFFPAVVAVDKNGSSVAYGSQAFHPQIRSKCTLKYPIRPSQKISKYSIDMDGVLTLLSAVFSELNVDPAQCNIQLCVPRTLTPATQAQLLQILMERFLVRAVNMTHQVILGLMSYNATSGVILDIGERIDVVPIMDGYMLESGVSRVPYGGLNLVDHLRHFLLQKHYALVTEAEALLIRLVLEKLAFVSGPDSEQYSQDLSRAKKNPDVVAASVSLEPYSNGELSWSDITLDTGRFQVTEGLFHPEAWGLDNEGVQHLVVKAVQESGIDLRKHMWKSIYVTGGVSMLPGFVSRLESELKRFAPPNIQPKVHASPYRYHASYIGACVLANSEGFEQAMVTQQEWRTLGSNVIRRWNL